MVLAAPAESATIRDEFDAADGENSNTYLWREADPVFVNTNYTYTLTTTSDGPDANTVWAILVSVKMP